MMHTVGSITTGVLNKSKPYLKAGTKVPSWFSQQQIREDMVVYTHKQHKFLLVDIYDLTSYWFESRHDNRNKLRCSYIAFRPVEKNDFCVEKKLTF